MIKAVAVLDKNGQPMLSRKTVLATDFPLDGVLSAFPKMMRQLDRSSNCMHTRDASIYFTPVEGFQVLLICDHDFSSIEADQGLRMIVTIIRNVCGVLSVGSIRNKAIRLLFAIDELVGSGYREPVPSQEIMSALDMYSYEEEVLLREQRMKREAAASKTKSQATMAKAAMREEIQEAVRRGLSEAEAKRAFFSKMGGISKSGGAPRISAQASAPLPSTSASGGISSTRAQQQREAGAVPPPVSASSAPASGSSRLQTRKPKRKGMVLKSSGQRGSGTRRLLTSLHQTGIMVDAPLDLPKEEEDPHTEDETEPEEME